MTYTFVTRIVRPRRQGRELVWCDQRTFIQDEGRFLYAWIGIWRDDSEVLLVNRHRDSGVFSVTINLLGRVYDVVLTINKAPLVIVKTGPRMWRAASPVMTHNVLAGLNMRVVQ